VVARFAPDQKTDFGFANLFGAYLSDARDATQAQLDIACGTNANLPKGLSLKPCSEKKPIGLLPP
jgi:uncharacterized protein YjbI with pentapeptide repeats